MAATDGIQTRGKYLNRNVLVRILRAASPSFDPRKADVIQGTHDRDERSAVNGSEKEHTGAHH